MKLVISMLLSVSAVSLSVPALAQRAKPDPDATQAGPTTSTDGSSDRDSQASATPDIVVTAQKREERIIDVPISVAIATQADLERQQVNTISDLSRIAPSLEILQAPGQNTGGGGQIRGVGTQTFNAGAVGAVGIVVDQVSQGNVNISDLFDIARVEVLKGPQGTLFGLTTSAGVINITTNAPNPKRVEVRARTELSGEGVLGSGFGVQLFQGLVNLPLSENSALRVSGNLRYRQGVNRNALTDDFSTFHNWNVRGRYLWTPTDRLTINAIGDYSDQKVRGTDFFTLVKSTSPTLTAQAADCGITVGEGNRDYCSDRRVETRMKTYGGSLQLDYDADPFTLTSVSSYRHTSNGPTYGDVFRLKFSPLQVFNGPGSGRTNLFTQEFRVASRGSNTIDYTAGVFVSSQKQEQDPEPFDVQLSPAPGVIIPVSSSVGIDTTVKSESIAIFGQANVNLTEKFTLIAGGRYTGERLSVYSVDFNPGGLTNQAQGNIDNFSWKLGAQYGFSRQVSAYATVARGYKGPQITFPTRGGPGVIIRPEIPMNYEAGLKASILDGRVLMDVSAFYLKLNDYQGQQCAIDPATGTQTCFQVNLDKVVSKGVELNFSGRPLKNLVFNVGGIYNRVNYPDGYTGADGSVLTGKQLAYAPEYKLTTSSEYSVPITSGFEGFLGGDAVYKSRVRTDATLNPDVAFRGHWIVGGRIGARSEDGRLSAAVFVRNLANVHEPVLLYPNFPAAGGTAAIYGTQSFRQVGLQLDAKF